MHRRLILPILLIACMAPLAFGQRVSFQGLIHQRHQPRMYINNIFLPHSDSSKTDVIIGFKIEYDDLTFLKQNSLNTSGGHSKRTFVADMQANVEVYKINPDAMETFHKWQKDARPEPGEHMSRDGDRDRYTRQPDRSHLQDLSRKIANNSATVARGNWKGSVSAETYEETQSDKSFLQGYVTIPLQPGEYLYQLQLSQPNNNNQDTRSFWRHVQVPDLEKGSAANLMFLETTNKVTIPGQYPLINMGNNAFFGKDFTLLCQIPGFDATHHYAVHITKLGENRGDTTGTSSVFQEEIPQDQIHNGIKITPSTDTTHVFLNLKKADTPYTYASLKIPNSTFENAIFRIAVIDSSADTTLGHITYQARWIDMPTSLYNLDIAIDMLRFMLPKSEIKKKFSGSYNEREKEFKAFWKKRDPTPQTAYNQLMAEYYRRIDYAYTHFSSMETPGYESDQGKIYIKYGPPQSVKREFPPDGPSIVIWNYPHNKFVFQATSGFGDYKLIKKQ